MDNDLQLAAEKVLKQETKQFIEEIDHLMQVDGLEKSLKSKNNNNNKVPGKTQFKDLMDAASKASCIEELMLFLSYQEAKEGGWEKKCVNGYSIARNVINSLKKIVDAIYSLIKKEYGNRAIKDEEERVLQLEITEKYMGYLYWKAYVVSKEGGRKNVP